MFSIFFNFFVWNFFPESVIFYIEFAFLSDMKRSFNPKRSFREVEEALFSYSPLSFLNFLNDIKLNESFSSLIFIVTHTMYVSFEHPFGRFIFTWYIFLKTLDRLLPDAVLNYLQIASGENGLGIRWNTSSLAVNDVKQFPVSFLSTRPFL